MTSAKVINITHGLLVATAAVWLLWDPIAFLLGGNPATESANLDVFGYCHPQWPLIWGYLTTHFFAQNFLPSKDSHGLPFFKRLGSLVSLFIPIGWFVWDVNISPTLLTRLIQQTPGPGHGAIEMVLVGMVIGYFEFQMLDATKA